MEVILLLIECDINVEHIFTLYQTSSNYDSFGTLITYNVHLNCFTAIGIEHIDVLQICIQ